MKIQFQKYQGTGNDFVMIDNRSAKLTLNSGHVKAICDRRFGVGADGIILLENHSILDFEMNYYNADGTQSFCGNGSRCVVRFAKDIGILEHSARYLAIDGEHSSSLLPDGDIATEMKPVNKVELVDGNYFINTGSPHYIIFTKNINNIDILTEAHKIRYSNQYSENGVNVNFVEIIDDAINVRTYERGVENETYSCGTGVTAVAIAYFHKMKLSGNHEVEVKTPGGLLKVSLLENNGNYSSINLIGPAKKVYEGEISI